MAESDPTMLFVTIATSSLVATVVTLGVNALTAYRRRRHRAREMLYGILLEVDRADECADAYTKEAADRPIWCPNYRIDVDFMREGLLTLTELGVFKHHETRELHRLYVFAGEVNRSLESLGALLDRNDASSLARAEKETSRCKAKCTSLLKQLRIAKASVDNALKRLGAKSPT